MFFLFPQIELDFKRGFQEAYEYFNEQKENILSKLKEVLCCAKFKNADAQAIALCLHNLDRGTI